MTNSQKDKVKMSNKVIKAIRHRETDKQRERESHFNSKRKRERESSTLTLIAQQTQRCKREK